MVYSEKESVESTFSAVDTVLLQQVLGQIKEEFNDHLDAINDNTNEIQSAASSISELDLKFNKICERLEKIELFLEKISSFDPSRVPKYEINNLTEKEKSIFLVIYKLAAEHKSITYREIQKHTCLPKTIIQGHITGLIEKGIPLRKAYINNQVHLRMDEQFKAMQAKQNIVKLEQKTLNHVLC